MDENKKEYEEMVFKYYSELIKCYFLKENESLGINARNKIVAQYNRILQPEKVSTIHSHILRIGNKHTIFTLATSTYISVSNYNSMHLPIYSYVQIYCALKLQFQNEKIDPMDIIATFNPQMWVNKDIQNYLSAALEYKVYYNALNDTISKINVQLKEK